MLSKIVHMGESNLIQTLERVPQAKTIEKCFHASASSKASRLVRVCGITSMNFARPLPNLRGVSGGPASWRWGDLPQTALRANKADWSLRSDVQACRAGTTATPSRLPEVKGLLLHKPDLMQSVPEPPSGRDGEQKFCQKFKNTKNRK
jgi:hypothetical protein